MRTIMAATLVVAGIGLASASAAMAAPASGTAIRDAAAVDQLTQQAHYYGYGYYRPYRHYGYYGYYRPRYYGYYGYSRPYWGGYGYRRYGW